ncbi:Hsp20/alpha crystallin family protein [Nocardia paucivorans]|uniref:Hsp20/alpha crystallin family protein n=1 Tax=Nocardia paucivorans TaxID=114259 RepID=UPI0002F1116C|nr:Hsp20/alpha crystallin family protein [Nocardia paucivorans]
MTLPARRSAFDMNRWDPFRELDDLPGRFGRWMDEYFNRIVEPMTGSWVPLADLSETENDYQVDAELPGVPRENVNVDVAGQELHIHGDMKDETDGKEVRQRARHTGHFDYRVTLPQNINTDKVEASLSDGVLHVRIPKAEKAKPRRIAITSGSK